MPKYDVGIAVRVWISKETNAPTREVAEQRILKQADKLINESNFEWLGGDIKHVQTTNMSLLNKIPY